MSGDLINACSCACMSLRSNSLHASVKPAAISPQLHTVADVTLSMFYSVCVCVCVSPCLWALLCETAMNDLAAVDKEMPSIVKHSC